MAKIKEIAVATIYVDQYENALSFYSKFLGFEKKADMGPSSCWGKAGNINMYIEGGNKKTDQSEKGTRVGIVLVVDSASEVFSEFKNGGVELLSEAPIEMSANEYWFLFKDPAGNILEIYGDK